MGKQPLKCAGCIFMCLSLLAISPIARSSVADSKENVPLIIKDSGIKPISQKDIGLVFYLTAYNGGKDPLELVTIMHKCCLSGSPEDCQSMHLIGGKNGIVLPNHSHNATLLFLNLYLIDRLGYCQIDAIFNKSQAIRYQIDFNTTASKDNNLVSSDLQGYDACESPDEDRLDSCAPVDCVVKYNGRRNSFNYKSKRCEEVPPCMSGASAGTTPTMVYVKEFNKCRDLGMTLEEEDLSFMDGNPGSSHFEVIDIMKIKHYDCHHGYQAGVGQGCVCDEGWASEGSDESQYKPLTGTYHMCNLEVTYHQPPNTMGTDILIALVCLCVGGLSLFILIALMCYLICTRDKLPERPPGYTSKSQLSVSLVKDEQRNRSLERVHDHLKDAMRTSQLKFSGGEFRCAKVLSAHHAAGRGELDLEPGDIITNLRRTSVSGLWEGLCNHKRGLFPIGCVHFYRTEQELQRELLKSKSDGGLS